MRRKIPSTAALSAFEAAARYQSFSRAADELAVTHSAVGRQIAGLEEFLGVQLFQRTARGLLLTDAGRQYAQTVRARLDEVERDALELMARGGAGSAVELGVVPTFATRWLMPRLAGFQAAHPEVTVHLASRARPFLFDDGPLDAAIHAGPGAWPGTTARFLMPELLIAVASPALVPRRRAGDAEALQRLPLLHMSTRPYDWRQWLQAAGIAVEHDLSGMRMELFSMTIEAAAQGLGVALVPRFFVERQLADGTLLQLTRHALPSGRSYFLIVPQDRPPSPALAAFGDWLEAEARTYREREGLAA